MDENYYHQYYFMERHHWWFRGRRRILEDLIGTKVAGKLVGNPPRILDIGCGFGMNMKFLAGYGAVSGVEYSQETVAFARTRNVDDIHVGSLPDLDCRFENLNLITMFDVLEHIANDDAALEVVYDRLAAKGLLVITVPAYQWLWSDHDVVNHHHRRYALKSLVSKIKKHSFEVMYASYFNLFFLPLVAAVRITQRMLPKTSKPRSDFKLHHPFVNGMMESLFASERHLLRSLRLPFGVSLVVVANKP